MNSKTVRFDRLPANTRDISAINRNIFSSPYDVAAMTVAVMCNYGTDAEETVRMLEWLRGGRSYGFLELKSLKDRLRDRPYAPLSYFSGALPSNGYQPDRPYSVEVYSTGSSYIDDDCVRLFIASSGSPSVGSVTLKSDDYRWFLRKEDLLSGVKAPE